jgi:LAO/AO transport system kinase
MREVAQDAGVFIRSMATRGALGGLSRASLDAVDILDAAGYDVVLIETVGVGQDEVEIVQAAHSVVVVSAPGLGDDIQAIKAGILEIADIHVVSKSDRADANDTIRSLRAMLRLGMSVSHPSGWNAPVISTSVLDEKGIDALLQAIDDHRTYLNDSGEIEERRRHIVEMRMLKTAEDIIRQRFAERRGEILSGLIDRVVARQLDPNTAAHQLLKELHEE